MGLCRLDRLPLLNLDLPVCKARKPPDLAFNLRPQRLQTLHLVQPALPLSIRGIVIIPHHLTDLAIDLLPNPAIIPNQFTGCPSLTPQQTLP
jgi:hypothetical protein